MTNYIEHLAFGKTGTFAAKYDQLAERNGQTFTVLRAVDPSTYDADECGAMYRIRFADGVEVEARPEEVESAVNAVRSPHRDFLLELSRLSGQSFASLVKAGYTESVSVYLEEGKTPLQVANVMASSKRHGRAREMSNCIERPEQNVLEMRMPPRT